MKQEDYVETLVINSHIVPVGIDDYGQCYYFEYLDKNGQLQEMSCGTYNFNYKREIESFFKAMDK